MRIVKAKLIVARRHWSDIPRNVPSHVREELQRAIDLAKGNAYTAWEEQRREGFSDLIPYIEESSEYWEKVAWEFTGLVNDVLDDTIPFEIDRKFFKSIKNLSKKGAIEKRISRVPKKYRIFLKPMLEKAKEIAKTQLIEEANKDPELHPDFDAWWEGGVTTYIEDASEEAQEWATKLKLW